MQEIIYNKIGSGYNQTRKADPYLLSRLIELLDMQKEGTYLDLGCGTGNYTLAFTQAGYHFTGVDPAEKMLKEATTRNAAITWLQGAAEEIPMANNSIDGIVATLTIHHWTDLEKSFREIDRVLKKNGKMVLFTSTPEQMEGYWLNHYFPVMLQSSIHQMPSLKKISEACKNAGLEITTTEKYLIADDLQDHFLYVGKNKPGLYFDETIRKGISSFAALANADEVSQGLTKLEKDIQTGTFGTIKEQYNHTLGDYLFIVTQKK